MASSNTYYNETKPAFQFPWDPASSNSWTPNEVAGDFAFPTQIWMDQLTEDAKRQMAWWFGTQWTSWWSSTLVFSSNAYNAVQWSSWTINLPGNRSYSISSGSVTWLTTLTFIYFDTWTPTVLQTTTTASVAVWSKTLMVWVCKPTDSGKTQAYFEIFWWAGGMLITGDQIVANSLTANNIAAWAITSWTIAVGAVWSTNIANSAVGNNQLWVNYAGSWSKWWAATDTNAVWWTSASTVLTWVSRATAAINASNRYAGWIKSTELANVWSSSWFSWVMMWADWLIWYKAGVTTFEINTSWDAYFKGTLGAVDMVATWSISTSTATTRLTMDGPNNALYVYRLWTEIWHFWWSTTDGVFLYANTTLSWADRLAYLSNTWANQTMWLKTSAGIALLADATASGGIGITARSQYLHAINIEAGALNFLWTVSPYTTNPWDHISYQWNSRIYFDSGGTQIVAKLRIPVGTNLY